jgi:hypothetical protein
LTKFSTASDRRKSRTKRFHAPSILPSGRLQAPRMIGATSAADAGRAGSFAAMNAGLRFFASRCSAKVTSAIMHS